MTSPRVRKLLNLLVGLLPPEEIYLEVGSWKGATLISALLDHPSAQAFACDNWSQFQEHGAEPIFFSNLEKYKPRLPNYTILKQDCFTIPANPPFKKPIGIFFYDGDHSYDAQFKAITLFAPFLSRRCVVLIDDWNWDRVRQGTWSGINAIRPIRLDYQELPAIQNGDIENYWNGVGAFYLELPLVGQYKFGPEA
jgi:hypothetical protein